MSTDASPSPTPSPRPQPVRVVVPVNHPEPIDTGIRVEVRRVAVDQLWREEDAERRAAAAAAAATEAAAATFVAAKLPDDPAAMRRMLVELIQVVEDLRRENADQRQRLDELLRQRHGPRPAPWSAEQPPLFPELHPDAASANEAAIAAAAQAPAPPLESAAPPRATKKPHGRRRLEELLPNLPLRRVPHELSEAERICPGCGGVRHKIGEQTTQQLDYQPARLIRVEHAQFTYSCPRCPEHIVTAPKPPQPIDRGLPGPGLLAAIVAHKYDSHQPLYRQELELWRDGAFVSRSTQSEWAGAMGELLAPLVERMKHWVLQSRVIQTDSTPVRLLLDGQPEAVTAHLWPYLGAPEYPYVVFDFSIDGRNEHARDFLKDYRGYVQADAASGYDVLFADAEHPKIEVGCWAHAERRFEAAVESAPELACAALGFVGALFDIEEENRAEQRSEAEVLQVRRERSRPILDDFKKWLDAVRPEVLPKSPLNEATRYVRNQWTALNRYTEAGFLQMDNNATERMNKIIARGRNNWLFVGSPRGGRTAAILFSITATCRRLEMDAFAYLRDLFALLPTPDRRPLPPERLDELLPDRWLAAHPEARYPPERRSRAAGKRAPP